MSESSLLAPALAWSGHLRRRLQNAPDFADWLADAATRPLDDLRLARWLGELRAARLPAATDDPARAMPSVDCRAVLRRLRDRVFCVAMVRDLAGLAPLEEVVGAMTRLAEIAVAESYRSIASELAEVHGVPREAANGAPQEMLIVGMGKLGGEELNVSSDIDLVMLYGDEGDTDGPRPISHHEFYGRLTRRMMPVISEIDADGHVFRTDLRLRPDGDSGPLAWSLDAFENYLVSQGREWERYAWLKGRQLPVRAFAGSTPEAQLVQLEGLRRPFVFRKYFDFDALAALRALRERIRQDWNRRASARSGTEAEDNVKLGEGGIREIEFVVQLSQLVRGGRLQALQTRGLLNALHAERDAGLIQPADAERLESAYRFLRRVEHCLQYREDQQTHLMPSDPIQRAALAAALGFDDLAAFETELAEHRGFVEATFRNVFRMTGMETPSADAAPDTVAEDPDCALAERITRRYGNDATALQSRLEALQRSPRIRSLPEASQRRLSDLLPATVDAAAATQAPAAALARLFDLIETIAQRSAYLALLAEYPETLARVARIVAASDWAAQYLMRHPLLLDELLDWRALLAAPDFDAFAAELSTTLDASMIAGHPPTPDVENQMNVMRDAQRQLSFNLLARDLEGRLSVEHLGDHLSMLADILLNETLRRVWPLIKGADPALAPRVAVIAYGKLGGKELGYASDLDLVFIYEDPRDDALEIYSRLVRRVMSWLGSMTSSGRLYEVDLRLRPDGDAGLPVISTEAFERYQREKAWPWEHQAITRARFAAGHPEVGARFEAMRCEVLLMPRDAEVLATEVRAMREKIHAGHPNTSKQFDLKHDAGGMVDVEFVTQYLVLLHAREHRQLLQNLGNIALLRHAEDAGLIPAGMAEAAGDAYRSLRREQHALRLQGIDRARLPLDRLVAERNTVIALWEAVLGSRGRGQA
jgi:glutamate-ammonia-ligase adenylyltransferase